MKFGLLLVGRKGKLVLSELINSNIIPEFVNSYSDNNVLDESYTEISDLCLNNYIKFYSTKDDSFYKLFNDVDKVFVIGWQFMLKEHLNKIVVLHDSYLPEKKGWSPTVNYLIEGSDYLAATAFEPTDKMDTGDIYCKIKKPITYPIKISNAIDIVSNIYVELIIKVLDGAVKYEMMGIETFCLWRDYKDYYINWSWSGDKIVRFINAVGYPFNGAKIMLYDVEYLVTNGIFESLIIVDELSHYGKILKFDEGKPCIVCKGGIVKLTIENFNNKKLKLRL